MKIYFEVGRLCTHMISLPMHEMCIIDASDGVIYNQRLLDAINECRPDTIVYTNSPIALNSAYCWNKTAGQFDVFIRSMLSGEFKHIQSLIIGDFNEGTDLLEEILEYYV